MSYRFFFRKTFSEKHNFNLSFPSHFISSSFPLRPSTSASPPHRCASSSWVINSLVRHLFSRFIEGLQGGTRLWSLCCYCSIGIFEGDDKARCIGYHITNSSWSVDDDKCF
ncbi:hypothetical protein ERO13_A03G101350v2 [Gossypium hirsutum]|uniref:Uncharacterized protein LOC107892769 isoform X1 n=4 Tax=Gossypium TaxID=3633 RepID=A0A1U8HLL7_GOSHI|nr:uncharacterized protein LOC107892769 isoform X1 [Gossypium hirsutum]XP_040944055.1 uncharacterized protein LOC107927717 isoform X1 [Gossypium hirsutum]XP_040949259.1 uncharacterized protein LOC107913088 isoform X1 [Gossypium hirsutum]XP_040962643.1 uncharacterized protein LOC121203017 isoform X1 [Gossypium hirsutum]TYG95695.1 hypothetical protein ES288_A11G289100v1 [Gossypium darwinii]KAG4207952.1 hypothetical protein ERO13_A03G101350v2 [Gossypium hirsutum]KAG4207953.1 hypothetical protein